MNCASLVSAERMTRQIVQAMSQASGVLQWTETSERQRAVVEMRSLLDEISREYELHVSTIGRHQQPQQQSSSQHRHDSVNKTCLSADEYPAWFGSSAIDSCAHNDSSQHSSSRRIVIIRVTCFDRGRPVITC